MNKNLTLEAHLSVAEIEERYQRAAGAIEQKHWLIILLLAHGKNTSQIVEMSGYCMNWVRAIIHRYNEYGPSAIGDRRRNNPGGTFLLSEAQCAQLRQILQGLPPDGGVWNGSKVAVWMQAQVGRPVPAQLGWVYLKRLGCNNRIVRPRLGKTTASAQIAHEEKS